MATNAVGRTTIQGATTVGGFNPATLFSSGEQGVWYDPSDLSTMYQDSAGTIPVTGLEQPVGRILDKSGRGNHATQATAANRPVLSARVNLLTYSQDVRNTAAAGSTRPWLNSGTGTIALASAIAPDGTLTGNLVPEGNVASTYHYVSYSPVSLTSGVSYTASVFLKQGTQRYAGIHFNDGTARGCSIDLQTGTLGTPYGSATATVSLVNGWYQLRVTATSTGSATAEVAIYLSDTNALAPYSGTDKNIYIWGADLRPANQGVGLPVYQRVGAATYGASTAAGNADYDANGFPYYLKFDGVDDNLSVADNAGLRQTDMTFFVGVNPLNLASREDWIACGNSLSFATNNWIFGNSSTSAQVLPRTPASIQAIGTIAANTALVMSANYTASTISARLNAVSKTPISCTLGTDNTTGMFIGCSKVNGAVDSPSNMNLYGLIVRGASSTANQITGAENWLNQRTGAY